MGPLQVAIQFLFQPSVERGILLGALEDVRPNENFQAGEVLAPLGAFFTLNLPQEILVTLLSLLQASLFFF